MEEKSYPPYSKRISRKILETPITEEKNAMALYSLRNLDRYNRLDPYLFHTIMEYQSYDPSVHTTEYAIRTDNVVLVQYLIDNNLFTLDEREALILATQSSSENVIQQIIYYFRIPLRVLNTVMTEFTNKISYNLSMFIIDYYDPPDNPDMFELTKLMLKDIPCDIEHINMLLNKRWITWDVVLEWVSAFGDMELIELAIQNEANPAWGVMSASAYGHWNVVMYLIEEHGAGITRFSIYDAVGQQNMEMIQYLISRGANINDALVEACNLGFIDIINYLLDEGADIRYQANAPMQAAIANGNLDLIRYVFERGAC